MKIASICGALFLALLAFLPDQGCADETTARRLYPETALVRAGEASAWVIYPSSPTGYHEMAERIVAAVKAKTGVELKMLKDTEVTEAQHPVLLDPYRSRNLILLGRLGINRAIWGVYNRFLCAEDGYYPGGDGYVVRTAANVYNNGANTIIAGGSSDSGAARAVDKLVERIAAQPYKDRRLVLPWLLDVELGGTCKKMFDDDERRQMARVFPGDDIHLDNQGKRFYENIMSYYWSGRETYLKLGLRYLDLLLERYKAMDADKRCLNVHYEGEFFVRAYDMIDDSGRLSADQVATTDQAIVDTFYRLFGYDKLASSYRPELQKPDGRGDEIRPVDDITTESHGSSMWLADKIYADFIIDKIPATAKTAPIHKEAQIRRALYVKAFDGLIAERWRACVPSSGDNDNVTMTFFRYALEMERYKAFFDSGNARKSALYFLARVANPSGSDIGLIFDTPADWTEYRLFAGIMASYDHDGELKQVIETMPGKSTGFYGIYVNGVHTYHPGPEVQSVPPKSLMGATWIPLQPVHYRRMHCPLPYAQTYNFATIRNGFSNEDYLLLCGGQDLPGNVIVRMASQGHIWLSHTAGTKYFNQNALHISRLSTSSGGSNAVPPAARLDHIASASAASFISSTLPDYAGTDWDRQIVCLPGVFFVVFDKITAHETDQYLIMANWRPNFYPKGWRKDSPWSAPAGRLEGGRWIDRDFGQEFIIAFAGNKIQPIEDADVDPVTRQSIPVYRQRMSASLKKGESETIANLMFVRAAGSKTDYELRQTSDGGLLARATDEQDRIYYIGALPASLGKSDAPLVVLSTNRLTAFNAGTLAIHGKVWADHEPAQTREIAIKDTAMRDELKALWNSSTISVPAAVAAQESKTSKTDTLIREWRYTGAQRPGLISGVKWLGSNTWDLGRVADLIKISAIKTHELGWDDQARGLRGSDSGNVHSQIWISVKGTPGTFKPFLGQVVDIGVPSMLNYGRIKKQEKVYQTLRGAPQKARFVKVVAKQDVATHSYLFYDAGQPDEGGDPMRARVVAIRDQGRPDILVYPNIWPGFREMTRLTHSVFALDPDGHERWGHEMKWRIFFVRALDWDGTGRKKIFVGSLDNNVYVYDGEGRLADTLTAEDRLNPSGQLMPTNGYPLAVSIGLWQPDGTGRRKLIMPRYVRASFLGRDGRVEGETGYLGLYWVTDVLDVGVDYTGDGIEDSAAMASQQIFLLTQDPANAQVQSFTLPAFEQGSLSGSPTLAFQLYDKKSAKLFVARQNMVALFDQQNKKWLMSWAPEIPIMAAVALPEYRQILCYTREGILWRIKLGDDFSVAGMDSAPVSMAFNHFAVLDRKQGAIVAASPAGLFRIGMDNCPVLLVPGSFVDVDVYPSATKPEKIIAVDKTGAVESYLLK